MTLSQPSSLSRRHFLTAAAAAVPAVALGGALRPSAAHALSLPTVTPVWSEAVRASYGVCAHPNFTKTVYGNVDAWTAQLADLGAPYFRGRYAPGLPATLKTIARCRALGIKWLMLVCPENWSMSVTQLKSVLAHIRDHAADVCIGIEGANEPNHNRDGSPVRPDWAQATVAYQRVIKEFVASTPRLSHVTVVGPSLQLGAANPYPDFVALGKAGIRPYMDMAGLHSYPGGFAPSNKVDLRLSWVRDAWGDVPSWISETGYNDAVKATGGHRPVPADVAATYGPRTVLEYFRKGCRSARFELLDDPNAACNKQESNFGMVECPSLSPSTWTRKPEFTTMKSFLGSLRDTGGTYRPIPVPLSVVAPKDVRWTLLGKSDGTNQLVTYLDLPVYDPVKRVRLTPAPVTVTVTDRIGTRTVKVGPAVTSVPIR